MNMFETIKKILVEFCGVSAERVTPEAKLRDDLGLDSLDDMEFLTEVETRLDVFIDDETYDGAETVADVVNLVDQVRAAA